MVNAKSFGDIDRKLTAELAALQPKMLKIVDKKTIQALHGVVGGKNNEYVDAVRGQFLSPDEFIQEWESGALTAAKARDVSDLKKYGRAFKSTAAHKIVGFLKDQTARSYIRIFLTRNFYRQYCARVRVKPSDNLWEIWFGANPLCWGLLICPRYSSAEGWHNDVSEIRRVKFQYWTIGHVLATGLVVPGRSKVHAFSDLDSLFAFYQNVILRDTRSVYSEKFGQEYEAYVRQQDRPELVPFLIPEFRFGGVEVKHRYRLDFAVLSAERRLRVGCEFSPWSSHGRVKGASALRKAGGAAAVALAEREQWEKDWDKRNAYFQSFGITALTYTDRKLKDLTSVFEEMRPYLEAAPDIRVKSIEHERRLATYNL